jgi:hypothetical protein
MGSFEEGVGSSRGSLSVACGRNTGLLKQTWGVLFLVSKSVRRMPCLRHEIFRARGGAVI